MGRAMVQAVSHQPLTPEAWVRSQAISCEFLWLTKRHWDRCFSENFGFSPLHIIPSMPHTHFQLHAALTITNAVSRIGKHCTERHFYLSLQASCRADGNAHDSLKRYCCGVLTDSVQMAALVFFPLSACCCISHPPIWPMQTGPK
jgi:hypothetical protein